MEYHFEFYAQYERSLTTLQMIRQSKKNVVKNIRNYSTRFHRAFQ